MGCSGPDFTLQKHAEFAIIIPGLFNNYLQNPVL
jgi:hypothetical protein